MKLLLRNKADRKLTLWLEPYIDDYELEPGEEVVIEGGLSTQDGAVWIDWDGDDLTVYDNCSGIDDVIVSKGGVRLTPSRD